MNGIGSALKTINRQALEGNKSGNSVGRLIILRHGQSVWNVTDQERGLTARFTGWADIGMTEQGKRQALEAGKVLASKFVDNDGKRLEINSGFVSLLSRARDTLDIALEEMDLVVHKKQQEYPPSQEDLKSCSSESSRQRSSLHNPQYRIPIVSSWRLNERHYGALVGLSKDGAEKYYGKEELSRLRSSWNIPPPPMAEKQLLQWERLPHCQMKTEMNQPYGSVDKSKYTILEKRSTDPNAMTDFLSQFKNGSLDEDLFHVTNPPEMPLSESFYDVVKRFLPIWTQGIAPRIKQGENVLVVAHANTIRSMLYTIDPFNVTKETMKKLKIPSSKPLVYTFRSSVEGRDGREKVVPGNLIVEPCEEERRAYCANSDVSLNGCWIQSEGMKDLSFCSQFGVDNLEHEIA